MKRADRRRQGIGAIELIEQAFHLLRAAPPATLACYYLGALPFVLGLLFFWADLSRSAFADQHLAGGALGVAALFLWLKFWQALFARNLRAALAGEPPPPLSFRQGRRMFVVQTALQPAGLFLLPLALIPALPFAWVYAFFQNLTALAGSEPGELRAVVKKSARQAALWPRQNHVVLTILLGFGLYVFLNWITVCLVLPGLGKTLLGLESVFTRSVWSLVNTTFFTAMFGLTYLAVDPMVKAVYALRCFYGESLASGEDLKAELRQFALPARQMAAGLLLALVLSGTALAKAAEAAPPGAPVPVLRVSPASVSPPELDRAIHEVLQQAKYAWRMPRERIQPAAAQPGFLGRLTQRVGKLLRKWLMGFLDWLREWVRKLFLRHREGEHNASGYSWIMFLQILLYALVAAVVAGLVFLLWRIWRNRNRPAGAMASQPIQPAPDLADENLGAEQLPEDRWTKLARELLERGELRLALRAFYLATLAHLAERNLISLARFKSNRDYERELRRRGHSFPDLLALFGENVLVFDRIWYGWHEINGELVSRFAANVERIKAGG